jgi:hypothetical protein
MSDDARRRLDAKKFNEHVKLGTTTVNAIAVFVLIAGFLQPVIQEGAFSLVAFVWIVWGIGLHIGAQAILRMLRDEA